MIGLLRLAVFGLIVLTLVYWLALVYARSVRRERLEKEYDEGSIDGDVRGGRDDYIAQGMDEYEHGLKRKLLWLVYILPIGTVLVLVWLNFEG
ncbi:hypothetical protein HYN69_16220 [Gemmobacter aquarius]|uniref:Cation/multidrug efflux pump n=1 Tax=Paragemmobacter aquarius TaxID=2169400 RepID=A0A2S0UPW4_9RHOB|nr:hypothetical protein [Gemmobacter aquarius]AWB49844.1 hypothetical protein HYN69_16220 [Gemmobacter aquarius]